MQKHMIVTHVLKLSNLEKSAPSIGKKFFFSIEWDEEKLKRIDSNCLMKLCKQDFCPVTRGLA